MDLNSNFCNYFFSSNPLAQHQLKTPGGTPYNYLYGEAPPETGIFSRLQVCERVGILLVEVYKGGGKSVILVCERTPKGVTDEF